jgi:hypothetical protein
MGGGWSLAAHQGLTHIRVGPILILDRQGLWEMKGVGRVPLGTGGREEKRTYGLSRPLPSSFP